MTNQEFKALAIELGLIENRKYGRLDCSKLASELGLKEASVKQMLRPSAPTPTWVTAFLLGYNSHRDEHST